MNEKPTLSVGEAARDFSKAAKICEEQGSIVLTEDGKPVYVLSKYGEDGFELTDEEKVEVTARRILRKYKRAFEVLSE